jgi:hypothetical protein
METNNKYGRTRGPRSDRHIIIILYMYIYILYDVCLCGGRD